MDRRIFLSGLAATGLMAPLPAQARKLGVSEISSYLKKFRTARAKFIQANPDKTLSQGVLYMKKPGRIRYEYTAPAHNLIVSDGKTLGIFDRKSNAGPQRYPLRRTPLDILLRDDVDLEKGGFVKNVQSDGVQTRVLAVDPKNAKNGSITMVFTANPIELRQWIVRERNGKETTVILSDLKLGGSLNDSLFSIGKLRNELGQGVGDK